MEIQSGDKMKVHILMTQFSWKSGYVEIDGVFDKRKNATKALEKFYKKMWKDITTVEGKIWPGMKKADVELFNTSGVSAWIETRVVRQ